MSLRAFVQVVTAVTNCLALTLLGYLLLASIISETVTFE